MIKTTFISDLHGFQPDLPGGDLLIIAGDLTARNTENEYAKFIQWLISSPYKCKILIAGNHDGLIESGKVSFRNIDPHIHYLCDSGFDFKGLKIWGSPYTPTFLNWYFMRDRGSDIKKHWDLIPKGIDILVTHGPPYGVLDETINKEHAGCEELKKAVKERVRPRIHCFGHIHEWGGNVADIDGIKYINCSYVDERYHPINGQINLEIKDDEDTEDFED